MVGPFTIMVYTWVDMSGAKAILLLLPLVLAAAGCYDSRGTDFDGTEEAGAFGRNWIDIFFNIVEIDPSMTEPLYSNGAFIIYFMDRDEYDDILKITANPPPTSMERVGMIYHKLSD